MPDLKTEALRIASELPKGDPTRRRILEAVSKTGRRQDKSAGSGAVNAKYLDGLTPRMKEKILRSVAKHYGVSVSEIESELTDRDAEALYEYLAFDNGMAMQVYRDFQSKHLASDKTARVDGKVFKPGTYFNTFFNEKGLSSKEYEVTDSRGVRHFIPTEVVLEALAQTRGGERAHAENILRKIDFHNGDVHDFLKHLAEGLARQYEGVIR